jgi:hypothetical protein
VDEINCFEQDEPIEKIMPVSRAVILTGDINKLFFPLSGLRVFFR